MEAKRDFTDRFLRSIKPAAPGKRKLDYDAQVPGFGIRVTEHSKPHDLGSFVLVARFPGSPNPTARRIGTYPAMSLSDARRIARDWRDDLARGIDPKKKAADLQRQEARRRADTFRAAFDVFAEDHLKTLRTGAAVRRTVEKQVFPAWGDRPLAEIRRADLQELLRARRKQAPIGGNRLLSFLKKFFSWAVDQDLIEASPAAALKKPSRETARDRVLTDDEVRSVWLACDDGVFGRIVRLLLLTGQRRGEVAEMRWTELDLQRQLWSLPRARTKSNRGHTVPLCDAAIAILDACPCTSAYVFAGRRNDTPIVGFAKAKERLDKRSGVTGWRLHDLRRTAATNIARLGVDRLVISKLLNHSETSVTGIYDRFNYEDAKRHAVSLWARRLEVIVQAATGPTTWCRCRFERLANFWVASNGLLPFPQHFGPRTKNFWLQKNIREVCSAHALNSNPLRCLQYYIHPRNII